MERGGRNDLKSGEIQPEPPHFCCGGEHLKSQDISPSSTKLSLFETALPCSRTFNGSLLLRDQIPLWGIQGPQSFQSSLANFISPHPSI